MNIDDNLIISTSNEENSRHLSQFLTIIVTLAVRHCIYVYVYTWNCLSEVAVLFSYSRHVPFISELPKCFNDTA